MTASAMAWEFRKGTIIPLPSAKTSFAYKYVVEIHIFPAPIAYAKAPEADCCGSKYGVIYTSIIFNHTTSSSKDKYLFINLTFPCKSYCFIFFFIFSSSFQRYIRNTVGDNFYFFFWTIIIFYKLLQTFGHHSYYFFCKFEHLF